MKGRRGRGRRWGVALTATGALVFTAHLLLEGLASLTRSLTVSAAGAVGLAEGDPAKGPPPTVDRVDLDRYQGRWYAVAVLREQPFQALCRDRTVTDVTPRREADEDVLDIVNACRTVLGSTVEARLTARIADPGRNAARYTPAFGGSKERPDSFIIAVGEPADRPGSGPYRWIVEIDADRRAAYIMARHPADAEAVIRAAAPSAQRAGVDLHRLMLEPQQGASLGTGRDRSTSVADLLRLSPQGRSPG